VERDRTRRKRGEGALGETAWNRGKEGESHTRSERPKAATRGPVMWTARQPNATLAANGERAFWPGLRRRQVTTRFLHWTRSAHSEPHFSHLTLRHPLPRLAQDAGRYAQRAQRTFCAERSRIGALRPVAQARECVYRASSASPELCRWASASTRPIPQPRSTPMLPLSFRVFWATGRRVSALGKKARHGRGEPASPGRVSRQTAEAGLWERSAGRSAT